MPLSDPTLYCSIVVSLVYLTITCTDIAYVVHVVSQFVASPTTIHWVVVLHFCGIFEVQSFKVFYFHLPPLWSYMHTLMMIMAVTLSIANMLLVSVSFWAILSFLRRVRNNILFLYLPPKHNIVLWHRLLKILFGYVGYLQIWENFFLIPLLCIVITKVLFRLLTTQSFMNEPNTLKLIVTLHIIILSMATSLCLLFLLRCSL